MASTTPTIPRPRAGRFLPPSSNVEQPYRLTPQLALRIGALATLLLAAFAILFLRLWALQVLSGSQYLNEARNNQLRTVPIQAPRGTIVDRNGIVLVGNTAGSSVQIWPADLPKAGRYRILRRLSGIVDVPVAWMVREIAKRKNDPLTPITVKRGIHDYQVAYLNERRLEFPGVVVAQSHLRHYEYRALAAQSLGHVGEASARQLSADPRLRFGDEIGQTGVEAAYDDFLRGRPGSAQLTVDSTGRARSDLLPRSHPRRGHSIRLTIDIGLQQASERAIRHGIQQAWANDAWAANGGAIVALDPRNGEVLALASNPTYKPSVYVGRVEARKLAEWGLVPGTAEEKNYPALNRAIAGLYPPGSTFKPVTALAAMQERVLTPFAPLECTPSYTITGENGVRYTYDNWDPYVGAPMTLPVALAKSCDTYFYRVGERFYHLPPERGHPLQQWASRLGFGKPTGIDIGPEADGLLPTPEWRRRTFENAVERSWRPGDSVLLSIGQGDLLVTPLQMTRFYAAIANGGRLVTPHLVADAEQPGQNGAPAVVRHRFTPPPPQPTGVDPAALGVVREGLAEATRYPLGTAAAVFDAFPVPVAGKTGTAEKWSTEYGRYFDQSWWCGYAPAHAPTIAVCAVIENGGHGGTAAAPAALKVFEHYFNRVGGPIGPIHSD